MIFFGTLLGEGPFWDGAVNVFHKVAGVVEGADDFWVVGEVVEGEGAAAAVFEPFAQDLVAADSEGPHVFCDAGEVLAFVDVDAAAAVLGRVGRGVFGVAAAL